MQVVKTASFLFSSLALVLIGVKSPLLAQTDLAPLQEFTRPQEAGRDPFSSNGGGSGVLDLIHRATLGGLKDNAQFQQEQRQNLNTAASDFRSRQLELIRSQQSPSSQQTSTPVAPVTTPASN